ncbi:pyridoxal-phosphate dependent enzyme [Janibacter cremeus]|uniref:pyridoxal-phosphate dependent enzyme n=1 Tax=Janibacter cremeus TaxID=1285192 RepID=UPI0023FA2098|nr:pyridoxal-phosphate dependent enzyme [Janibacter cremeus]WEV77289.1 pyridoxal-phosphate dependent enzyme [Janibacter cremeus]
MTTWYSNPSARTWSSGSAAPSVRDFHRGLPGYEATPLVALPALAEELGVGRVLVKDESARLGLPAFKMLGASWACHQVVERHPGAELVTATDGNHGRAVARMATHLGTRATVFIAAALREKAAARIEAEGATLVRVEGHYDDAVHAATEYAAADPSRELVQDTAWEGYEQVPTWVVEGYDTLLQEIDEQLGAAPDLVVVPSGVGSLAQAVIAHYRQGDRSTGTRILSVEPDSADCIVASLTKGEPVAVETGASVMAGLNCGTVSTLAWPVLREGCDAAITVTDEEALQASADLLAHGVASGPSGAATYAGVRAALRHAGLRADLDLPADAAVVLLSTEGRQDDE